MATVLRVLLRVFRQSASVGHAMKLLTHNMLMSPGTRNGYPLAIEVEKMEEVESEFNSEFMARMVEKIDYGALITTLKAVCVFHHFTAHVCAIAHSRRLTTSNSVRACSLLSRARCRPQCLTNLPRTSPS